MTKQYEFRKLTKAEVPQMFQMILDRMKWMDKKGIKQWNVTNYDEVYPIAYYEEAQIQGEVFGLFDQDILVAAALLKTEDDRWHDNEKAFYLHNFVSREDIKNGGALFLEYAEQYARKQNIHYFRLDSAQDNEILTHYYESRGFLPVGTCIEGLYHGILRQKKLR